MRFFQLVIITDFRYTSYYNSIGCIVSNDKVKQYVM